MKEGESSTSNISETQHGLQIKSVVAADDDVADSHSVNSIHDTFQRYISPARGLISYLSGASGRLNNEMTSAQIPPNEMDVLAPNMTKIPFRLQEPRYWVEGRNTPGLEPTARKSAISGRQRDWRTGQR